MRLIISILFLSISLNAEVILNKVEKKQINHALRLLDKTAEQRNAYDKFNEIRDKELLNYFKTWFDIYNITILSLEARIRWLEEINTGMAIKEAKEDFYKAEIQLTEFIKIKNKAELIFNETSAKYSSFINEDFFKTSKDKYRALSILDSVNIIDQLYKDAKEIETRTKNIKNEAHNEWSNADSDMLEAYNTFKEIDKNNEIIDPVRVRIYAENAIEKTKIAILKLSQFIEAYEPYIKAKEANIKAEYGYIEAYRALLIDQPQYFL